MQRVEDDDLVDPVEELGAEHLLELVQEQALDALVLALHLVALRDQRGADVARHDDDRVLEVDGAALVVGEAPVVEDLQQHVEDVGVRLLDLVEQDDAVRPTAHRLGELAALLVADVAGRRADEPRDAVALHVLAHVEAHHGLFVVEEELGQRPGELGLPHARGAEEDERADRPLRVLEPGARPPHGLGDGHDRTVLADDPAVQLLLHVEQLLGLGLLHALDGDAGPAC